MNLVTFIFYSDDLFIYLDEELISRVKSVSDDQTEYSLEFNEYLTVNILYIYVNMRKLS